MSLSMMVLMMLMIMTMLLILSLKTADVLLKIHLLVMVILNNV